MTLITVLQKKIQYYACNSMIDVFSSGLIIMDFKPNIIGDFIMAYYPAEPFRIKSVEPVSILPKSEREKSDESGRLQYLLT